MCIRDSVIPTLFPWFRYLFWLFQGDYHRTFSLFSILGLITLSMIAFSRYLVSGTLNLWLLGLTTFVLVVALYLPFDAVQRVLNHELRITATVQMLCFSCLLATGKLMKRQTLAAYLVLRLAAVELVLLDQVTVSMRKTVTKQELKDRVGYNDETIDLSLIHI